MAKTGCLSLLVFLLLAGCASPPPAPKAPAAPAAVSAPGPEKRQEYRVGPNDLLQVDVFQVEALSREARVNSNGEISLPLIGMVSVRDLSVREAESLLKAKLGERYLQDPQVTVTIKEYTNQRVTIEGLVKKPGVYSFKGDATLLHAIALSEGVDEELANTGQVRLFRDNGKGEKDSYLVDLGAIRKGEVEDPALKGGDVIVVQEHAGKSVWKSVKAILNRMVGIGMSIPLL
jgi:polysaccharide export outer membrane protein